MPSNLGDGMHTDSGQNPLSLGFDFRLKTVSPAQALYTSWVSDILIYIVILNLFDEFTHGIHIGSFWISILVAVLFKILLVVVGKVEHLVHHALKERGLDILAIVGAWVVILFGKLGIIELVNVLFDEVELHGILTEIAMIVLMILTCIASRWFYQSLGSDSASQLAETLHLGESTGKSGEHGE